MKRERLPLPSRPFNEVIASLDVAENGFHAPVDMAGLWNSGLFYILNEQELNTILNTASELHSMYMDAVQYVLSEDMLPALDIPHILHKPILSSWENGSPGLLGRLDLCCQPDKPPILFNYSTDMPSGLLEAAFWQRRWLKAVCPQKTQFNEIQQKLQESWEMMAGDGLYSVCFLSCEQDRGAYSSFLMKTAVNAGLSVCSAHCDELTWDITEGALMNGDGQVLEAVVETCGWLRLLHDCSEASLASLLGPDCCLVEPPWRFVMGHSGMLAVLWELFEGHAGLVPASFAPGDIEGPYDRIPFFPTAAPTPGVQVYHRDISDDGLYGMSGYVYRSHIVLPRVSDGDFFVVQVWMVGDEPAGICVQEMSDVTTGREGRFVPHWLE
jgi:glutathionylspermidine synthase